MMEVVRLPSQTVSEMSSTMNPTIKLDGLDVSAASIAVAVTDSGQARPRYQGAISNPPEAVTQPEALSLSLDSDHRSKPQPHPT